MPNSFSSDLELLDLSGVPGRSGGLVGTLPSTLRKPSQLQILTVANQQMDGAIPSFTSTLSLLALHNNRLKVLPDIRLRKTIFLHNNLLSCYAPMCGNGTVNTSLIAIGNRLRYPKGEFPAWVLEYERDPLFWVSGADGISLIKTLSGAVGLFLVVLVFKLGSAQVLRAMSGWQVGPVTHLWVVKASSHMYAGMLMGVLLGSSIHHAPSVVGPLCLPTDTGSHEALACGAAPSSAPWCSCLGASSLSSRWQWST